MFGGVGGGGKRGQEGEARRKEVNDKKRGKRRGRGGGMGREK